MNFPDIINTLKSHSNPESIKGMARFGINSETALGVSMPTLRSIAKTVGKSHSLAEKLWSSGIHEARILASIVDDPKEVTENQLENWAHDFNSWDICDQCCMNLFRKTPFSWSKAIEWSQRSQEFVKRAGFALMAALAVHDKKAADNQFNILFAAIQRESCDERNFVKKAVNWALRQIGKRNLALNKTAIEVSKEIQLTNSKSAKWIASNAIKELTDSTVLDRLMNRNHNRSSRD